MAGDDRLIQLQLSTHIGCRHPDVLRYMQARKMYGALVQVLTCTADTHPYAIWLLKVIAKQTQTAVGSPTMTRMWPIVL